MPAAAVQYKSTTFFAFKTTMAKTLVEIAKEMGIQYTGTKKTVWDWIIRSGHVRISFVADDGLSFTFQCMKPKEGSVPLWVILTPEHVPNVEGIDMKTGADCGFFGRTNPNNAEGATLSNFCTGLDQIDRPVFDSKNPPPPPGASAPPQRPPQPPNEKGNRRAEVCEAKGLFCTANIPWIHYEYS